MNVAVSIKEQTRMLMYGAQIGDPQFEHAMAEALLERLRISQIENRPLRVYAGYDPSKPDLHIGHSITIRKLRQFQDLGHDVTFVVGTFTAQVGDTSDKLTGRPRRTEEEVRQAAASYAEQSFKILDPKRTTVVYNHEWLSRLKLSDVVELASNFTVQQFLSRDAFKKRLASSDPIGLHETLYPLLQGYDAVHLRADVQIGASEQLFNIQAGRKLQEASGQPPCICITFPILVGIDGIRRMSKSSGNYVGISESPDQQFGKTMSISDETMLEWLKYVTRWRPDEIDTIIENVRSGLMHPMECKKKLAWEIVSAYHGDVEADEAQLNFESVIQGKQLPEHIEVQVIAFPANIVDVLMMTKVVSSRTEARRLIENHGVRFDDALVSSTHEVIKQAGILRAGKRRFVRLVGEEAVHSSIRSK
jgi:tyrosyl-tRNA synthetase